MTGFQVIRIDGRRPAARPQGQVRRRSQRDSQTLLVAILTLTATLVALYDLVLLGLAVR